MKNHKYKPENSAWDQLKEAYETHSVRPSDDLWGKIEARLDETLPEEIPAQKIYWPYAATVLLCISIAMVGFWWHRSQSISTRYSVEKTTEKQYSQSVSFDTVKKEKQASNMVNVISVMPQKVVRHKKNFQPTLKDTINRSTQLENDAYLEGNMQVAEPYVSASDLLFSRELEKERKTQVHSTKKIGKTIDVESPRTKEKIIEPYKIEVLGVTVYDKE